MLLADSLERIDSVQAGPGLLIRLRGRGPGPGRLPARLVLRTPAGTREIGPLPGGGAPSEPDTWRLAFAVPRLGPADVVLLAHGDETPARLRLDEPLSPAATARLQALEAELTASCRRRELGERERIGLQEQLFEARAQLEHLAAALAAADRRAAQRAAEGRAAAARVARLEDELEELLRERRRAEREAERGVRPDQQPTRLVEALVADAPSTGEPLAVRRIAAAPPAAVGGASSRRRPSRLASLAAAVLIATVAVVLLQGAGGDRPARDDAAAAAPGRASPPTNGEIYGRLYRQAADRYGLDWRVLAAIGEVESGHGTSPLPGVRSGTNAAGAAGPMQFTASSWEAYGLDGDGDGRADIYDPGDAIPAAASFLRAHGAPRDWHRALGAYNRASGYASAILSRSRAAVAARRAAARRAAARRAG